jgi:hypothetical protein
VRKPSNESKLLQLNNPKDFRPLPVSRSDAISRREAGVR